MTIIAWDTRTIAADKQINCGDAKYPGSKCRQLEDGTILAWAGCIDAGLILAQWYEDGADPEKFPFDVKDKALADLIVVTPDGRCFSYCQAPYPVEHTAFAAWGSSIQAALCCMELGAGAVKAVEVVSKYSTGCGFGVDSYRAITSEMFKRGPVEKPELADWGLPMGTGFRK